MSPATATTPKKAVAKKGPAKPTSYAMVKEAIVALADRKGSSLPAIKKYIAAHHKVDVAKRASYICKAIKTMVEKGVLVQTKGHGAAGSFKLAAKSKPDKIVKKAAPKSPKKKTTVKKIAAKAAKTPTKKKAPKKTAEKKSTKAKTPKKAPKATKKASPAKKPAKKTSVKKATKKTSAKKA